jgi:hypothetical protein
MFRAAQRNPVFNACLNDHVQACRGNGVERNFRLLLAFLCFLTGSAVAQEFETDGHYLVGRVLVPVAVGKESPITLHVQKDVMKEGSWTDQPLVYRDGREPARVFAEVKLLWQKMYGDMLKKERRPMSFNECMKALLVPQKPMASGLGRGCRQRDTADRRDQSS